MDRKDGLLRSLLFVPGSDTRKLGKVARFGADAIVIDLEDAVADEEKVGARATTRAAIPDLAGKATLVVRVNGIETGLLDDDVAAIAVEGVDAHHGPEGRVGRHARAPRRPHRPGRGGRRHRAGDDPRPRAHRDRARDRRLRARSSRARPSGCTPPSSAPGTSPCSSASTSRPRPPSSPTRARASSSPPAPRAWPRRSTAPGCGSRTTRAWRPTAGAPGASASRAA